ncbi:hypothetical protein U6B65_11040 [Oscillospiraceae bacterium MB08-C2-2]|nr:hypothetical protein U6B65_11040 [Oscillospiraceae bacterium MB08-C2-2]
MADIRVTRTLWDFQETAELEGFVSAELLRGLDSPAASLRLVLSCKEMPEELSEVWLYDGQEELFAGKVDTQRFVYGKSGAFLELEARSREAVLLDNQAKPGELSSPTLLTLSQRCAQPYGFTLLRTGGNGRLNFYNIPRGISEWEAMAGYAQLAFQESLYMQGGTIVVGNPPGQETITLSNSRATGQRFISLTRENRNSKIISEVYLRDNSGAYSTRVINYDNPGGLADRKRYMVPLTDYSMSPRWEGQEKIRRAMLEKETVRAVLPGYVQAAPGDAVRVRDSVVVLENLQVYQVTHRFGKEGATTVLNLISSLYS